MISPPVLYVEDDDDLRSILSQQLSRAGFAVTAVGCAEDALSVLGTRRFDAMLTDYQLPGHNASWLIAEACARGLLAKSAVVVLSADRSPRAIEGCAFIRKPADISVIVEALRTAISPLAIFGSCIHRSRTLIRIVAHGIAYCDQRVSAWAFPAPWRQPALA
jgi:CheY-like chemotaxis protein